MYINMLFAPFKADGGELNIQCPVPCFSFTQIYICTCKYIKRFLILFYSAEHSIMWQYRDLFKYLPIDGDLGLLVVFEMTVLGKNE